MHCYLKLMIQELFSMTLFLSKSKSSRRHNQYFVYVPLNITHEKKANENSMISKTKKIKTAEIVKRHFFIFPSPQPQNNNL